MQKRGITFLLAGALLATMTPSVAAAGWRDGGHRHGGAAHELEGDYVPGCFRGWTFSWANQPVPNVRSPGIERADRNGDGWNCYRIVH